MPKAKAKSQIKGKTAKKRATAKKKTAPRKTAAKAQPKAPTAPEPTPQPTQAPAAAPAAPEAPPGEEIGMVTDFFAIPNVAAIRLTGTLSVGDKIAIKRADDYIEQTVNSMQIDRKEVQTAGSGDEIGVKIEGRVHQHNKVYKI